MSSYSDLVGRVANVPVFVSSYDDSDLFLHGRSVSNVPFISAVISAVEFELFDHTYNFSRNFENFMSSEGFVYSADDVDFADYVSHLSAPKFDFTGDEWWDIGLFARELDYVHPNYARIEHWLMVQLGRLYLCAHPDFELGENSMERAVFKFAVKRIRNLYPVNVLISQ